MDGSLCGVWIDGEGRARVCVALSDGGGGEKALPLEPLAWLASASFDAPVSDVVFERLKGDGVLGTLAKAHSLEAFDGLLRAARESALASRSEEHTSELQSPC